MMCSSGYATDFTGLRGGSWGGSEASPGERGPVPPLGTDLINDSEPGWGSSHTDGAMVRATRATTAQSNARNIWAMRTVTARTRARSAKAVSGGAPALTVVRIATSAWTKCSNRTHPSNDAASPQIAFTLPQATAS